SPAGIVATICVLVIEVGVIAGFVPKFTVAPLTKPVPDNVNGKAAPPAVSLVGAIEASVGAGFAEPEIANTKSDVVPPPGARLVTVTLALPGLRIAAAGIVAVNCPALTNVVASAVPLKFTTEPWTNPPPVTVKVNSGPPAAIVDGLRDAMAGSGFESGAAPGAGKLAEASSRTSTQSLSSGGVKIFELLFAKEPINV